MALPIRPPISPTAPIAPRADVGRMAAQKAFFQAALAKAEPTAAPAAPAPTAAAAPTRTVSPPSQPLAAGSGEEAVKKIPRPGTFLDIRV